MIGLRTKGPNCEDGNSLMHVFSKLRISSERLLMIVGSFLQISTWWSWQEQSWDWSLPSLLENPNLHLLSRHLSLLHLNPWTNPSPPPNHRPTMTSQVLAGLTAAPKSDLAGIAALTSGVATLSTRDSGFATLSTRNRTVGLSSAT